MTRGTRERLDRVMTYEKGGTLGRFLRHNAGLVGALLMLALMLLLWMTGLISVGQDVPDRQTAQRLAVLEARVTYLVCTSVPPQTRNELRALVVDCGALEREMNVIQREEGSP